ncbi:hypothetical protein U1Q18_044678 [Sarracenia purpurea var. burkii]
METSTTNPKTSEPLINLELNEENNGDNLDENDFHFGYLTVESSTDPPRLLPYRRPNVFRNNFEGTLANVGDSNVPINDFEEASNLVFYEKIPSLQEMTASTVAIALWRRVISLDHSKRKAILHPIVEFVRMEDQNEVCKLIQRLPVPRLIRGLVENCLSLGDELNKFIDVIDRLFDTDDLNKFKASVVEELLSHFQWSEYDEANVLSILSWCVNNDDQKIKEFKKSIPIDNAFECRFDAMKWTVTSSQKICTIFAPIDNMLLWCFECVDKVKKYKLEKEFGYSDRGYRLFIRNNNRFDEEYARIILPWFFNGDEEQIRKFKEKYKDDVISNLIDVD